MRNHGKRIEALEAKVVGGDGDIKHIVLYGGETTKEMALAAKGLTSEEGVFWIHLVGVENGPEHPATGSASCERVRQEPRCAGASAL